MSAQVEVFRKQDAKRGVRVAQVLEGFISRKVVKQTVMTVVYGVTRYGGRLQIERRLRELSDFPQVHSVRRAVGQGRPPQPPPLNRWLPSSPKEEYGSVAPLGPSAGVGRPPWL